MGLSPEESIKLKEAFDSFDRDKNGTIDRDELKIVLEMMGYETNDTEIGHMMAEADAEET